MKSLKDLFKKARMIILIVALILAIWAISPHPFNDGVAIKSVVKGSAAFDAGIQSPLASVLPTQLERIVAIDEREITSIEDYYGAIEGITTNQSLYIKTNRAEYILTTKPLYNITVLAQQEEITTERIVLINGSNQTITNVTLQNKTIQTVIGTESIGLFIEDAPKTNIRLGLDLQGGTRVLLEPDEKLSSDEMELVRSSMEQRLNVYGLSNVIPRIIYDRPRALGGEPSYISVEIAGANVNEVRELLSRQGKFEAMIGDEVVFIGGRDINDVCRRPECSGINPQNVPRELENGTWAAGFWFTITVSPEAAQRQAQVTDTLSIITVDPQTGTALSPENQYLNQTIDLLLDDEVIDSLNIARGLKGNAATSIQITGVGYGQNRQQAMSDALENMKKLQTVLITGSMPVKMNIVKADTISPVLGKEFSKNAVKVGLLAILVVVLSVMFFYKDVRLSIPIAITMLAEVTLLMGMASLARWDLDLAAIAGIIIAVGTGVDDQIVITDEVMAGMKDTSLSWKDKIQRAFFIVMNTYFTTVVAMIPLLFAGAGLLKGFALTTIAGATFGVLITRQAFAAMVEYLYK